MNVPEISVIIPTFNEAANVASLIATLRALNGPPREIIVTDGGSHDQTVRLARESGAIVVETARGRGAQLNAGAQKAHGEILWFVHADAKVHPRSLDYLQNCAGDRQIYGGNFRLRFARQVESQVTELEWAPHFFARIARQQRRLGIYYGDSGLWVRREIFVKLNGFAPWPLFEDYDFARRLENYARLHRAKTALSPWPITVSSRRFCKSPLRVLGQWLLFQILFSCGASPENLAKIYHKNR